jgi:hypothetical protein
MLRALLFISLIFMCAADVTIAQSIDSLESDTTATESRNTSADDEEFNIVLYGLFFSTIALSFAIGIIGVILTFLLIFIAAALMAAGIISIGALRAYQMKSLSSGIRTIIYLCCATGGIIAGTTLAWIAQWIWHWSQTVTTVWIAGITGGLLGGLIAGAAGMWIIRKAWQTMLRRNSSRP